MMLAREQNDTKSHNIEQLFIDFHRNVVDFAKTLENCQKFEKLQKSCQNPCKNLAKRSCQNLAI